MSTDGSNMNVPLCSVRVNSVMNMSDTRTWTSRHFIYEKQRRKLRTAWVCVCVWVPASWWIRRANETHFNFNFRDERTKTICSRDSPVYLRCSLQTCELVCVRTGTYNWPRSSAAASHRHLRALAWYLFVKSLFSLHKKKRFKSVTRLIWLCVMRCTMRRTQWHTQMRRFAEKEKKTTRIARTNINNGKMSKRTVYSFCLTFCLLLFRAVVCGGACTHLQSNFQIGGDPNHERRKI